MSDDDGGFDVEGSDGWRLTVVTQDQPMWPVEEGSLTQVAVVVENEAEDIGNTFYLDPVDAEQFGDRIKRAARNAMTPGDEVLEGGDE